MLDRAELYRNIALTLGGLSAVIAGCKDQSPVVKFPALPTNTPVPTQSEYFATATIPATVTPFPTSTPRIPVPTQVGRSPLESTVIALGQRGTATPTLPQIPAEQFKNPQVLVDAKCADSHEVLGNPGILYPPHVEVGVSVKNIPGIDESKKDLGYWVILFDHKTQTTTYLGWSRYLSMESEVPTGVVTLHGYHHSIIGSPVRFLRTNNPYSVSVLIGDRELQQDYKRVAGIQFTTPNCPDVPELPDLNP